MLVRCPRCKTTYKVSDEVLTGATPVFRCSRCRHTFELESHARVEQAAQKPSSAEALPKQSDKEEELTFIFPSQEAKEVPAPETASKASASPPAESRVSWAPGEPTAEQWSMNPKEPKRDANFGSSTPPQATDREKIIDSAPTLGTGSQSRQPATAPHDTGDNVLALDPYRDQPASIVPYLTLFVLLVAGFGLLTAFHQVHPQTSEGVVKKIPLLGTSVLKNNHLKTGVDLQSLRAGYHTIQGNREVFAITGVAVNLNPGAIRDVRVAGHLYNEEGAEIELQTIWIGNAISSKIIRGMTTQDISDLQRLKPLKTFDIPPGDSVPFTIVFLKTPKGVKNFSCEVLSAEAEG